MKKRENCEVRPPQNEGAHTAHVWMQTEPCVYAMEKKVPTHPLLMQTFLKIKKILHTRGLSLVILSGMIPNFFI